MPSFAGRTLPPSSPATISRSSSASSSSSQLISTPPPRPRSKTGSRLLPALPLSNNTQLTPTGSKRVAVDYSGIALDGVHITMDQEEKRVSKSIPVPPSPDRSASPPGTPPRPARRSARRYSIPSPRPAVGTPADDLIPLHPAYARFASPSTDSFSTVSDAPTPRPTTQSDLAKPAAPFLGQSLASVISGPLISSPATKESISTAMGRKRDSAQRRLSALRGLVANLDFNQPWSMTEAGASSGGGYFWACGDPQESDESATEAFLSSEEELIPSPALPISMPMPLVPDVAANRPSSRRMPNASVPQDHGWDSPKLDEDAQINTTPVLSGSLARKPSSTPPRRPRQFRSSSELDRTPEPPRPVSRQRKEVFKVASSGYSKCHEPVSPTLPTTPTSTWRASLSSDDVYTRLLQTLGPVEMKRQEVMWEMSETEHAFVKSMRTVLRLFAIPLKTPQGKWIDGIPGQITELFDSLERIAHAHGIVSAAQRDMRRRAEVLDVGAVVAMFKSWIGWLDVHQWYLLHFEAVVQLVEENVHDSESVFGEFVRMQMKEEVLGSMSLGSMLLKPVQRLTKYPLFLKVSEYCWMY